MKYMILQAGFLGILLLLSLSTLRDSNKCDGTQSECDKIRSSVSCKAQLVSPIALSFPIKNSSVTGASVALQCGWETATSQIRICIVLCAIYATWLAYQAASTENRKNTDTYLSSTGFLSFLLITTAFFDAITVIDSIDDNFTTCSLQHKSRLTDFTSEGKPCSFMVFWLIAGMCFICSLIVYNSHASMQRFRKVIAIDGL